MNDRPQDPYFTTERVTTGDARGPVDSGAAAVPVVAVVTMKAPGEGPNTMGRAFTEGMERLLGELDATPGLAGVVLLSGHDDFMVGANLKEIEEITSPDELREGHRRVSGVLGRLAALKVPTIAVVTGNTLGGGTELALAASHRLMCDDPQAVMALPEVNLGLIPGAGGTQRLPRLVGVRAALDMILTGKRVFPGKALKMGLVDRLAPRPILREAALRLLADIREGRHKRRGPGPLEGIVRTLGSGVLRSVSSKAIEKKTHGLHPAPVKALDVILEGVQTSLEKGLILEREAFLPLVRDPVSLALRHLLLGTMELKKKTVIEGEPGQARPVHRLGIVGAGFMGAGIGAVALEKGARVILKDRTPRDLGAGLKAIHSHFRQQAKKGILPRHELPVRLGHVIAGTDDASLQWTDLIIEAIPEVLALKQEVLATLQKTNRTGAVIASNTSGLPIAEIAAPLPDPGNVVGMHFFSPVAKMPLIEVVVPPGARPDAVATVVAYGRRLGKTVILVRDGPGFFTTRVIGAYINEMIHLLFEGAAIDEVDRILVAAGFPVGAFQLLDEVGLDVAFKVNDNMARAFGERLEGPPGWQALMDPTRLGRKSGKGFYRYEDGKRIGVDEGLYRHIPARAAGGSEGPDRRQIEERALFSFIHETLLCLQDGILPTPLEGDIGAVLGLGFPPHLGGPFFHLDSLGLPRAVERFEALSQRHPRRFDVPAMLKDRAAAGQPFFGRNEGAQAPRS